MLYDHTATEPVSINVVQLSSYDVRQNWDWETTCNNSRNSANIDAKNRGLTGLKRLLNGYIKTRRDLKQTITEENLDLNQNLSEVKKILRLEPRKRALIKANKFRRLSFAEYAVIYNASYVSDIVAASDLVQSHFGSSCGDL